MTQKRTCAVSQDVNGVTAIRRMHEVLIFLSSHPEGATLAEISIKLTLPRSSASRLVSSLTEYGYLHKPNQAKVYTLGYQIIHLAKVVQSRLDIVKVAQPFMETVNKELSEMVKLSVRQGSTVVVKRVVETLEDYRIRVSEGSTSPLYCGASNKVLLAFADLNTQESVMTLDRKKFTPNTITKSDDLKLNLERIRGYGFGYDDKEYVDGICAVAVPIFDFSNEVVASLSIPFIDTLTNHSKTLQRLQALFLAAKSASDEIGGEFPYRVETLSESAIDVFRT